MPKARFAEFGRRFSEFLSQRPALDDGVYSWWRDEMKGTDETQLRRWKRGDHLPSEPFWDLFKVGLRRRVGPEDRTFETDLQELDSLLGRLRPRKRPRPITIDAHIERQDASPRTERDQLAPGIGNAAGVERIESALREEAELTRLEFGQHRGETVQRLDEIRTLIQSQAVPAFTYVLPSIGLVVGRETEIESGFREWMTDRSRPLLIWGPPGIGKSTLALALLHHPDVAQGFGSRRFQIRCDGLTSAEALQLAMGAEWFGLPASPNVGGQVLARLSEGPAAIVVDNFETTHRASCETSEEWLRRILGVPDVWLIVSIQGHEAPGGIDWIRRLEPTRLTLEQPRELFCRISGITSEHNAELDRLLSALDGVPHAIELLARQADSDAADLPRLAARWNRERTKLLRRGIGTTRQTSIAISYEFAIMNLSMTEIALRLLRVLANLPSGLASNELQTAVAPTPDGSTPEDAAATLKRCALAFTEADRLRMFAPLRTHVQLTHPASAEELRSIRDTFLRLARLGAYVGTASGGALMRKLTQEHLNCHWAVVTALAESDPVSVSGALGLAAFTCFSGIGGVDLVERARNLAHEACDRRGEADCIQSLGDLALARSNQAEARRQYETALPIYHEVGNRLGEANCIKQLGDIAFERGDHAEARRQYETTLAIYHEVGNRLGEANCIRSLGDIALAHSDHEEARRRYESALPMYGEVEDPLGVANCIERLGHIALGCSDHLEARRRYKVALTVYRVVGSRLGEAECIERLGDIALVRGDHDQASRGYEEAMAIYCEVGSRQGAANCIQSMGDIALACSDYEEARRRYKTALPIYKETGSRLGEANCIKSLGDIALGCSDYTDARRQYEIARPIYREVGSRLSEANCIRSLGEIAIAHDDDQTARERFQEALLLFQSLAEPFSIGWTLRGLARLEQEPSKRLELIEQIVTLWSKIDRDDLVQDLAREFPGEVRSVG